MKGSRYPAAVNVPVRILYLEDNPADAELIKETLRRAGLKVDLQNVDERSAFQTAVMTVEFDLILADYNLPSFNGKEALSIAQAVKAEIPFIYVSGSMEEAAAVDSLLGGATDYVLKNNLSRLVPAVKRALAEAKEKQELRVAEAKKIEAVARLQESEAKYRRLVEGLRDVVFSLGKDGTISSLNPAFERFTGWQADEWIGKSFTNILHPDDRKNAVAVLRDTAEGKNTGINEYRIVKRTGEYLLAEINTTGDFVNDTLVGFVGVARDITGQKELREQSLQSQRLESLGTLASGIAHDFNNILAIILNYADSIKDSGDPSGALPEQIDPIIKAVNRGAALVKQILAFSRAGRINLAFVPVNRLVKDLVKMLKETFPSSIAIEMSLTEQEPVLNVDSNQLYQALLNLCVNSREAILHRRGENIGRQGLISVTTETIDGEKLAGRFAGKVSHAYASILISDNGVGMGADTVRRAFEPYFTTKENENSEGLGLSFVYGTVKQSAGFVEIRSTEGKGTDVLVYLPLDPSSAVREEAADSASGNSRKGSGEMILIVEDESLLMTILDSSLREDGYRTLTAQDGLAALKIFESRKGEISLVLSDNGLPVMDGISLFQKLQEIDPSVKMILTSGYMEQNLKDELIAAGLKDFVGKPYKVETVMESVSRVLQDR